LKFQIQAVPSEQLIIFVKAPRRGTVKTRLAASIGAAPALAVYRRLVAVLREELKRLPNVELRYSPDDAASEIAAWLQPDWRSTPQGAGDLGQRMNAAFAEHFAAGAERVVIVGSDCPDVSAADIRTAWAALRSNDVMLGPATDGGYWLIGLRAPQPELFAHMPWSRSTVLKQTLERARELGLSVGLLRELSDVDTVEDWEAVKSSKL
jgi:uncharacterized protein